MTKNADYRTAHIAATKHLVIAVSRRESIVQDLCPLIGGARAPDKDTLRELAKVEADIRDTITLLQKIEKDSNGTIGVAAVVPNTDVVSPEVRIGLALLVSSALTSDIRYRSVNDLAQASCAQNADQLVNFLEAWRRGGVLRNLCRFDSDGAANWGEMRHPRIRQSPLLQYLCLEPDDEFDRRDEARELLAGR